MTITHEGGRFWAISTYAEKDILKGAGFRWDPAAKEWWTSDWMRAAKLLGSCDPRAGTIIEAAEGKAKQSMDQSRATDAAVEIPCPAGKAYLPFQTAGIVYALRVFGDIT